MRSGLLAHALLAFALAAAACGGGNTETPTPATPSSTPTAPTAPTTTPTAPTSTGSSVTAPPPPTAAPGGHTKPIVASSMAADLQALGLDPKNLPPLGKMKPDQLRQLMKTFTKATGMQCAGCHEQNDFHAPTPNKKLTSKMWDNYVRGLTFEDGSLVYCDSCHQGQAEFLDAHDKKALGTWMNDNFVSKLKRVDKKDHSCSTAMCHGENMEMEFLAKWKK